MKIENLEAKEVMQKHVVKAFWNMTVTELIKLFQEKGITGAPVVDDYGKLIGVVSETDVMRYDISESPDYNKNNMHPYFKMLTETDCGEEKDYDLDILDSPDEKRVEDIMTPWTFSATEDTSVPELARMMVELHVHRVLIVGHKSNLQGIVTTMDIAKAVSQLRMASAELL